MLFRHLEISGVGPFAGHHVIDFDSLTSNGVFLFEGPTGSGKSSIIDAIVFALYGKVAGTESDDSRVRSTHAAPSTPSWIDLVFTVSSGTYRVHRSPRFTRPSQRGSGMTEVSPKATLWRLSEAAVDARAWDTGEALASGSRDVGIELSAILGLTRAQFVQTVVLPQGQFADFLRLGSGARSELLETLFSTEDYRAYAKRLADQSRAARKQIDEARNNLDKAVHSWMNLDSALAHSETVTDLLERTVTPEDSTLIDSLRDFHQQFALARDEAQEAATLAGQKHSEASAAHESATKLESALRERHDLIERREILQKSEPEIDRLRKLMEDHLRAALPAERLRATSIAETRLRSALASLHDMAGKIRTIAVELSSVPESGDGVPADLFSGSLAELGENPPAEDIEAIGSAARQAGGALDKQLEQLTESIGALKETESLEASIHTRTEALERSKKKAEADASSLVELQSQVKALPEEENRLKHELAQARAISADLGLLTHQLSQLQVTMSNARTRDALLEQIEIEEARLRKAIAHFESERQALGTITSQWIASVAAELADELAFKQPCPVCGSIEHPAPASGSERLASREDVEAQQLKLDAAKTSVDTVQAQLVETRTKADSLASQLEGETLESLIAKAAKVESDIEAATIASQAVTRIDRDIAAIGQRQDELQETISQDEVRLARLRSSIDSDAAALEADKKRINEARGSHETIAQYVQELQGQRSTLTQAKHILSTLQSRTGELHERIGEQGAALDESRLSIDQVRAAVLSESQFKDTQSAIRSHEDELARVNGRLDAPDLKQLTGEEKPDTEATKLHLSTAAEFLSEAQKASTLATSCVISSDRLLRHVIETHETWAKISHDAGPVVRLAQLANADTVSQTRIPLSVWVLLKRFEIVLERANEHLLRFSRGRYELVRSDDGEKEHKVGLGLKVVDHDGSSDGDELRSTRSLSGGETFYAALSLALALAEVVQEESGGVRIDTLVIDEGFGTLDQDTRDVVMETLTSLTNHGRKVGIVSHVEELKQLVSNRVVVRPRESGGSTLNVVA